MRILAALALAAAALAVPTAALAYGSEVSASSCNANGGYVTRPAGTDITIRQGWSASTKKYDQDFIRSLISTYSVTPTRDWITPEAA